MSLRRVIGGFVGTVAILGGLTLVLTGSAPLSGPMVVGPLGSQSMEANSSPASAVQTPQEIGVTYAEPIPPTEAELAELRASNPPNQVTEVVGVMMESTDQPLVPSDPKPKIKKPARQPNPPIEVNRRTREVRVLPRPEPEIDEAAEAGGDTTQTGAIPTIAVNDDLEQETGGGTRTPGLGVNFEGLFSGAVSPGDPDMAVGTTTLVSACNSTNHYRLHDKTGLTLATATQTAFHGITSIGDARAIFDPNSQRYFIMALVNSCTPQVALGLSKTSTPDDMLAGAAADRSWLTWTFTFPGAGRLPDFPQIGVDENAVYLTANMFNCPALNTYLGVTMLVIPKAQLLAGAAAPTSTAFQNLTETWSGNNFQAFTVAPTLAYGSPGIGILGDFTAIGTITDDEGNNLLSATIVTIYLVTNPGSGAPTLSNVPVFLQAINTTAPPNVPQMGTATLLRNNGSNLHPMTYRDGSLWMCHSARITGPLRSRIDWAEVDVFKTMDPDTFLMGWDQGGFVQNASRYYWFPKITADKAGNAGMVMNGSQSTEFAGAYYATRASSDAADSFQAPLVLKAGAATYSDGGNPIRWGDYSGISVDPVDGLTFWATSQWAKAAGTWSSWIGAFTMTAQTTTLPFFDNFETPGLAPGLWALSSATVDGVGTNEPSGANSVRFNGTPRGQDTLRTRQIDLTGLSDVEVSYWVQRGGGSGNAPEAVDLLSVDYVNNVGNWANLNLLAGTGAAEGSYTQFTHTLPADAYHAGFRLRFSSATAFVGDDWFVDDVGIAEAGIPTGACCNAGACTVENEPDCTGGGGDYQGDDVPCSPGLCVPAATVNATISRRFNPSGTRGGNCDALDNTVPFKVTEPHSGGVSEVRIGFDLAPAGGGSGWSLEQSTCAIPAYAPYSGAAVGSGSIVGNELVISFSPALENARTYRVSLDASVTTVGGQTVEVRGLVADATADGFVNSADRSAIVGIWTGPGFSCVTDITNDGVTNSGDRSAVVGAWTGVQNCAP